MSELPHIIVSDRRTLSLEINHKAEVVVRSPRGVSEHAIRAFLESKAQWIKKHIDRILSAKPAPVSYAEGALFLFLGEEYPLRFVAHQIRPLYFQNGFFLPEVQRYRAREILLGWYRAEALKRLKKMVEKLALHHDLSAGRVRITDAATRWGSCGHRGTLNFSWRIIMAPPFVAQYVVAHELAHLTVKNHSARFWRRVEELCPDYRIAHEWLKDHGSRLKL